MNLLKYMTHCVVAATVAIAGSVTMSANAQAASTPEATCGAGYHVIDHHALKISTIWLLYNGSTDCVVVWKTAQVGTKTPLLATVGTGFPTNPSLPTHAKTSTYDLDFDSYAYYAGPVYWYAPGKCIVWGGSDQYVSYGSKPSHCD